MAGADDNNAGDAGGFLEGLNAPDIYRFTVQVHELLGLWSGATTAASGRDDDCVDCSFCQ